MKIIKAKILNDGVNLSIAYELPDQSGIGNLIISLENVVKNYELVWQLKGIFGVQDEEES